MKVPTPPTPPTTRMMNDQTVSTIDDGVNVIQQFGNGYDNNGTLVEIISKHKRTYKDLNASGLRLEVKLRVPATNNLFEWLTPCMGELLAIMEC